MSRSVSLVAAIVVAVPVVWSASASAQLHQEAAPLGMIQPEPGAPKLVEGKVMDIQRAGPMVTMLRLDNGTELVVPSASRGPGPEVAVGTPVAARYVVRGDKKITTLLQAVQVQAP